MPDRVPTATYRLQLTPDFGFRQAAAQARYLADLGVSHAYLSPILQAGPGSTHGYDVVDHSTISADLGGEQEFRSMAAEFAGRGIGIIADVVPNHMAVPVPEYLNAQLWSVLRHGPESAFAHWFDIDWAAQDGKMLLPILARPLRYCLGDIRVTRLAALPDSVTRRTLSRQDDEPVLQYHGHVLPLRPDAAGLPIPELLDAQHYRLDSWRAAAAALNWRRFFDISSLIAVRVEDPDVFAATHAVLAGLVQERVIHGLRVDHPDGLADPRGYLRQLAAATGDCWIVAEKILAADEELPGRLAVRRDDRLRRARRRRRAVHRPGRDRAARPRVRAAHRRSGGVRTGCLDRASRDRRARADGGSRPAGPAGPPDQRTDIAPGRGAATCGSSWPSCWPHSRSTGRTSCPAARRPAPPPGRSGQPPRAPAGACPTGCNRSWTCSRRCCSGGAFRRPGSRPVTA